MRLDRRLLAVAWEARLYLLAAVGSGLLTGIVTVLQALCLSRIVAAAFLDGRPLDALYLPLAALLGLTVLRAMLAWGREVSAQRVASEVKRRLRERAFARLVERGPVGLQNERTGELASTLTEGTESLDAYFGQYLPNLALAVVVPLTILLVVFPLDLLTGVVFLVTAPLIPIFMALIGRLADALTRRQWESLSRMSAHFLDVLQGLTTLKLLGRSRTQGRTIAEMSRRFGEATLGVLRVAFLSALVLELQATISTAIVAVEVGLRLLSGQIPFVEAFFILILAPEFYAPLRALGASFHAGLAGVSAAERVFALLEGPDLSPRPPLPRGEGELSSSPPFPCGEGPGPCPDWSRLRFEDVHYAYPGGRDPRAALEEDADERRVALRGVSFEVERGQTVALVGPSGSGKSTVAHLLLRFAEPERGRIALDGAPLAALSAEDWRSQVAWVPQRPYLLNATVAENIRLGQPSASRSEVVEAAQLANADEFIRRLPNGYETPIGEQGARLSGGQAQRLALARAFLKDAPLLILDEAAASLDAEQERLVQEAIERLARGRTVLAIAHRLGAVRRADSIVVLEEGRVVQVGRHEELAREAGLYGDLVTAGRVDLAPQPPDLMNLSQLPECSPCPDEPLLIDRVYAPRHEWRGYGSTAAMNRRSVGASAHAPTSGIHARDCAQVIPNAPSGQGLLPRQPVQAHQVSGRVDSRAKGPGLLRLLKLLWPLRGWVALSTLLGFLTVGSGIGLMATSAFIIASAALHPPVADLMVAIVGVRFFGISRAAFRYLERYVSHAVTFRLLTSLRVWFYEALEPLAPARLLQHRGGDLLTRIVADVETLQHLYVRVLAPPLVAGLVLVLVGLLFAAYDRGLALAQLSLLLVTGLGVPLLTRRLSLSLGGAVGQARAALAAEVVDGVQGLADLMAFGQERRHVERVRGLSRHWLAIQGRLALVNGLHSGLGALFSGLGAWTVLALGVPLVSDGRLSGVSLAVLALASLASFEAVLPLPMALQHLGSCREAARRLFEIVDAEAVVREPEATRHPTLAMGLTDTSANRGHDRQAEWSLTYALRAYQLWMSNSGARLAWYLVRSAPRRFRTMGDEDAASGSPFPDGEGGQGVRSVPAPPSQVSEASRAPETPATLGAAGLADAPLAATGRKDGRPAPVELTVAGLRFRYGPAEPWALDGVGLRLAPGQRLAVVGPSGAGKSTLVHLLLRFWEPSEGTIRLAGRDLQDYSREELSRLVAVVSQRTHLFNATIRENLQIARPGDIAESEMVEAARRARIHDFVAGLPRGYDTPIGEQGLLLSGGQRQRLAVARALLQDAPLLVLDEATANLDSLTEREVRASIEEAMDGRAVLAITHRLVGLEAADEVIVLEAGRVVERGSHAELLRQEGLYARMWRLQEGDGHPTMA